VPPRPEFSGNVTGSHYLLLKERKRRGKKKKGTAKDHPDVPLVSATIEGEKGMNKRNVYGVPAETTDAELTSGNIIGKGGGNKPAAV